MPKVPTPKVWSYDDACIVAGELYGNILGRDSDEVGYKFTVGQLIAGKESVQDIVRRFCTSDEFREKYVMNQTPNELARRLIARFTKRKRPTPEAIKELAIELLQRDWRSVAEEIIATDEYVELYGRDRVPVWI